MKLTSNVSDSMASKNPPRLRTRIAGFLAACTLLAGVAGFATEPPPESGKDLKQLLQEGLFEEEASHDLGKAAATYSALIAKVDAERGLAATAIFRLAEVRSKQGRKEEAAALWQRIVTEFPAQAELVKLSRERLSGMGVTINTGSPDLPSDEEAKELRRLQDIAKNSPDLLFAREGGVGQAPLDVAAAKGWLNVADFLIKQGAKTEAPNAYYNPLVSAAAEGHKAMVDFLLDHGADTKETGDIPTAGSPNNVGQYTALMAAIANDRQTVFRRLLERGADVNAGDYRGRNPLFVACQKRNLEVCKILLAKGANPNVADTDPPATLALNQSGVPFSASGRKLRYTPLFFAAETARGPGGSTELLELLLEKGAKPLIPDGKDVTEVESAIEGQNTKALKLLLPRLPKISMPGVLSSAIKTYDAETLAVVAGHMEDINREAVGVTPPLVLAIELHWLQAIPILLEAGASPKAADPGGATPLLALAGVRLDPLPEPGTLAHQGFSRPAGPRSVYRPYSPSQGAFPSVGPKDFTVLKKPDLASVSMNAEWAVRRPYFEALLAKGGDLNATHRNGTTPFTALLIQNDGWPLTAIDWFMAHGANLLGESNHPAINQSEPTWTLTAPELRPELARRYLFSKLAKPEAISLWKLGASLAKPITIEHDAQHETPPTLAELITPNINEVEKQPSKPAVLQPSPGAIVPRPSGAVTTVAIQYAAINRKGADGRWTEAAVVKLPVQPETMPKLEWGDAVFLATEGRPDWDKNQAEEQSPK